MKNILLFASVILMQISLNVNAQNITQQSINVNQNQQSVNINVPVIEKKVYIDRYRTVYIEKRAPKRLSEPVTLLGFLCVFPEDIGNFQSHPNTLIRAINNQGAYGRNNWRIPTHDELMVMEANADKIGLGDDIYMATSHSNGILRLVSTGKNNPTSNEVVSNREGAVIGNLVWGLKNYAASNKYDFGMYFDSDEYTDNRCPAGWRVPTIEDFWALISNIKKIIGKEINGKRVWGIANNDESFWLPLYGEIYYLGGNDRIHVYDNYIVEGGSIRISVDVIIPKEWNELPASMYIDINERHIESKNSKSGFVRYVKDL